MKLHIQFQQGELNVNEIVEGADATAVVAAIQAKAAQKAGFLAGTFIRQMTPLQFAQEATRRYNKATGNDLLLPSTCEAFVQMGIAQKFATQIEA